MNWILVTYKVGDQETSQGKEHMGLKDGMPVCYLDPNDPEQLESISRLSDNMKKIYMNVKVPRAWLPDIKEALRPQRDPEKDDPKSPAYEPIDPKTYRARKALCSFSEIEAETQIVGLETGLRSKGAVEIIDCTRISKAKMLKSSVTLNPKAVDRNATTSGTHTVGTGMDFATMSAAVGDLGNLTGDCEFVVSSSLSESSSSNWAITYGGYKMRITTAVAGLAYGVPGNGYKINIAHNGLFLSPQGSTGGTTSALEIRYLNICRTTDASAASIYFIDLRNITNAMAVSVHHNIFDLNSLQGRSLLANDSDITLNNYRNRHINGSTLFFANYAFNAASKNENNFYYNSAGNAIDNNNQAATYNNEVFFAITNDNITNNTNSTTNNAATDSANGAATNNDPQINLTISDEVESTTQTNSGFLMAKATGNLATNGTAPAIAANTIGIRGNAVPSIADESSVTIGDDQVRITPSITSITPATGAAGTAVTISGTGFGLSQGDGFAKIGGTEITVDSWNNTEIAGTTNTSGSLVVQNRDDESDTLSSGFTIPRISRSGNAGISIGIRVGM